MCRRQTLTMMINYRHLTESARRVFIAAAVDARPTLAGCQGLRYVIVVVDCSK